MEKSCSSTKLTPTDSARSMDPSTRETDSPSSSNAHIIYGCESQPKSESDTAPSTSGTARNGVFKLGMCYSAFFHL